MLEAMRFGFLAVMFVSLWAWLFLLSRIANSILLELEEIEQRLPERELDGLWHGANDKAEDAERDCRGERDDGKAMREA